MNVLRRKRNGRPSTTSLDLDYETAPASAPKPLSIRAYVGGVLYVEGFIVLIMGSMLLLGYWPPVSAHGHRPNPVSQIGLWLVAGALIYMVVVGIGAFLYHLFKPAPHFTEIDHPHQGVITRARRYASMKRRTYYIFDDTIRCQQDAEDAMKARELY